MSTQRSTEKSGIFPILAVIGVVGLALAAAQPASGAVLTDVIKNRAGTLTYNVPGCGAGHTDNGNGTCTATLTATEQDGTHCLNESVADGCGTMGTGDFRAGRECDAQNDRPDHWQYYLAFDTSSIPDAATITAATLSLDHTWIDTTYTPARNFIARYFAWKPMVLDMGRHTHANANSDLGVSNAITPTPLNTITQNARKDYPLLNIGNINKTGGTEFQFDSTGPNESGACTDSWAAVRFSAVSNQRLIVTYSGSTLSTAPRDFQQFTNVAVGTCPSTTNCWTKPSGATVVIMEVIGGGGGGGGGHDSAGSGGAGGGGGGALAWGIYNAADLPATLAVTVGASGTAATAPPGGGGDGGVGGPSQVTGSGFTLSAYGGGGGHGASLAGAHGGGGGGGTASPGATSTSGNTGGNGGNPTIQDSTPGNSLGGRGGLGGGGDGSNAEYGGGGGGSGGANDAAGSKGGSSLFAAGGGGGGGGSAAVNGGAGGAWGSYTAGSGVAGGTSGIGTAGTPRNYGAGGGGGGGYGNAANSNGGAGGAPGGGGGGGGSHATAPGTGGAGGRGEVRIWSW